MAVTCTEHGEQLNPGDQVHIVSEHPHHEVVNAVVCHAAVRAMPEGQLIRNCLRNNGYVMLFPGVVSQDGSRAIIQDRPSATFGLSPQLFMTYLPHTTARLLGRFE